MGRSFPFLLILISCCLAITTEGRLVGEYRRRDVNEDAIQKVAHFAATQLGGQLLSVISASSQVVAGVNYKLLLVIERQSKEEVHQVVVFRKEWKDWSELAQSVQCYDGCFDEETVACKRCF